MPDEKTHTSDEQVAALKAELMERELEIKLLSQQCKSLHAHIRDIHASTSWRITAPVRAISGALKSSWPGMRRRTAHGHGGTATGIAAGTTAPELPDGLPAEDSFVFYRIIGNDLHPRHRKGQSLENLRFILDHEPDLPGCEKKFILNRILDRDQERRIVDLLEERGFPYIHIPFDLAEYRGIGFDTDIVADPAYQVRDALERLDDEARVRFAMTLYRHKNNYVMNANGARNVALADGRFRAKWILPWDGNCFLTSDAWASIRSDITKASGKKYFIVPMARMLSNEPLVGGGDIPEAVEEPQIIFRADAIEQFNPSFFYGHRDKVELLWRLGVRGAWTGYNDDPWDQARPRVSPEAASVGRAGWVARLFSGSPALEVDTDHAKLHRGLARSIAVIATLQRLDADCQYSGHEGLIDSLGAEDNVYPHRSK